jgi:hypothetical protein
MLTARGSSRRITNSETTAYFGFHGFHRHIGRVTLLHINLPAGTRPWRAAMDTRHVFQGNRPHHADRTGAGRPRASTVLALAFISTASFAAPTFGPADIIGWEPHSFAGTTDYRLVEIDDRLAIQATCTDGAASGLFYRRDIDLTQTPIVEWEWRVDQTLTGIDETARSGDDYPARLYLVDQAPILRWRTRALNYVWSSTAERGQDWPNAFAAQARMIAVATAEDAGKGWRTERRNVVEDFRRFHDHEPTRINAIAVMTDCDNTGQETRGWYGNIRFLPQ